MKRIITEEMTLKEADSMTYGEIEPKIHRMGYIDQEELLVSLLKSILAPNNPNLGPVKKTFLSTVLLKFLKIKSMR